MPRNLNSKGIIHLSIPILLAIVGVIVFLLFSSSASFKNKLFSSLFPKLPGFAATGAISNITDNSASYPNGQIPKYEKYEVTFDVATNASNPQLPYDPAPPPGMQAGVGVTVNGEFSQDNFTTKTVIPAFYYQNFDYQVKSNREWFYPTSNYSWKLRFAPDKEGTWQYRITAQDSSGTSTSGPKPLQ
ncbi:DUF5060 domain-containing protein [Candidatus Daviesbacteria bacterium]|nr:DUF5060 domain-containing protein [Candidatus Daviesbacteria bacterium]